MLDFVPCSEERSLKMMPDQRNTAGLVRRRAFASDAALCARSRSALFSAAGVAGEVAS
jgi:hypothetical protein